MGAFALALFGTALPVRADHDLHGGCDHREWRWESKAAGTTFTHVWDMRRCYPPSYLGDIVGWGTFERVHDGESAGVSVRCRAGTVCKLSMHLPRTSLVEHYEIYAFEYELSSEAVPYISSWGWGSNWCNWYVVWGHCNTEAGYAYERYNQIRRDGFEA